MMRRSLVGVFATIVVAAGVGVAPAASADMDVRVLLGLAEGRDLLSFAPLDNPGFPAYVSGDDEVVQVVNGQVTGRITGLTGAADLTGSTEVVLVALPTLGQLAVLDTVGGFTERGRIAVGSNTCPQHFIPGTMWFFVGCTAPYHLAQAVIPADAQDPLVPATIHDGPTSPSWASLPTGVRGESHWWIGSAEGMRQYELHGSVPVPGLVGPAIDAHTLVAADNGGAVIAGGIDDYRVVGADDGVVYAGPFDAPTNFDAAYATGGASPGLLFGTPGTTQSLELRDRTGAVLGSLPPPGGSGGLRKGTLGFNGNAAVGLWDTADGSDTILAAVDARPRLAVTFNVTREYSGTTLIARMSGTVKDPEGNPIRAGISLTHTDRRGPQDVDVSADNKGRFEEVVSLDLPGHHEFTVATTEQFDYAPSTVTKTLDVRALPWDLAGTGRARLVVGAPGEAVGTAAGAGAVTVLGETSAGRPRAAGSTVLTQGLAGISDSAESGDAFGHAVVSGDFDADGYADLAIGAPLEDVGDTSTTADAGSVTVVYGSASGPSARSWTVDAAAAGLTATAQTQFGWALAAGDFDGDGFADLGVGAPGLESVVILGGTADGLTTDGSSVLSQSSAGVDGTMAAGDRFGSSLAVGDLTGDGRADLAVGAPADRDGHSFAAGSVTVLLGSSTGLTTTGSRRITKETAGVQGASDSAHPDKFGASLAIGYLTEDLRMDLAIGSPGTPVTSDGKLRRNAGVVHVLPGTASGVTATGDKLYSQQTTGIGGSARKGDRFGAHLDIGQTRPTYVALLAINAPGDQVVHVVPGVTASAEQTVSQSTAGVPGATEPGDEFGASLRFVGFGAAGWSDLVVGVPGENDDAGSLLVLRGTTLGVLTSKVTSFSQSTTDVPGSSEPGDRWGWLGDSH